MNLDQALTFEKGYSIRHIAILAAASEERGCQCQAYRDYFTYQRWLAQGMQVQKGQKGVKLHTFQTGEKEDPNTGKIKKWSRPWSYTVFCRCQVAEREV